MQRNVRYLLLLAVLGLGLSSGCAVYQPRGKGLYQYVREPMHGAGYHLYLPVDYVKNNGRHPNPKMKDKWPLVMTFHGMKPYDNALPQEREWEKEADLYGYIVCAPELHTSDSFMEYPLTREHSYVLEDRRNVMAIMDHVFATTHADPKKVLSTSWSCGGYLAHYFPNRYPEKFSCIATRLSNFSAPLLLEDTVHRYNRRIPVAIFIGDGDFPKCKSESEEAVAWYTARGFSVRSRMIDNMGHHRIPQTAAAFFAESIDIDPLYPVEAAATVAQVRMTEYRPPPEMIARFAPPIGVTSLATTRTTGTLPNLPPRIDSRANTTTPPSAPRTAVANRTAVSYTNTTAGKNYPHNESPAFDPTPRPAEQPRATPPTQLASANPQQGNWLAATANKTTTAPPSDAKQDNSKPSSSTSEQKPPSTAAKPKDDKPAAAAKAKSADTPSKPTAEKQKQSPPPSKPTTDSTTPHPTLATSKSAPPYGPTTAGTKQASAANSQGSTRPTEKPTNSASRPDIRTAPDEKLAMDRRQTDRVRRVNIKLGGPAIGTTPHYLRYEVDLPPGVQAGSDFLWMDNGVWIGDEPRGVKILESPGLHRISVLVVTPDNIEYRGSATVHVLDRGPATASATK